MNKYCEHKNMTFNDDIGNFICDDCNQLVHSPVPDKVEDFREWQCCPVCIGTGRSMNYDNAIPTTLDVCTVCNGKKIIERPKSTQQSDEVEFMKWVQNKGYRIYGWDDGQIERIYQLFKKSKQ